MRILVVEDNPSLATQVVSALGEQGYAVDHVDDGERAWYLGDVENYSLIVLDLGLPSLDGLSVLGRWRESGNRTPVLVLTARDTWRDKVNGLRTGADDYLAKPFEMEELMARVEALIRRSSGHATAIIECAELALDPALKRVTLSGKMIALSALEYRLIAYLIQNQARVVSKRMLNDFLYQIDAEPDSNAIEVLINRCRKKIGSERIRTLRGHGYQLVDPNGDQD
ncbi:response regulator transcription factor [Gammaproteobacteria bacterium]|nr:response regulator transcription factor [Gammaproteobacteria bacterium]